MVKFRWLIEVKPPSHLREVTEIPQSEKVLPTGRVGAGDAIACKKWRKKARFKNQAWKSTKLLFKCLVQSYSKVGDICTAAFLSSSSHLFKIHRISLISEIHLKCQNCPAVILFSGAIKEIVLSLNHFGLNRPPKNGCPRDVGVLQRVSLSSVT